MHTLPNGYGMELREISRHEPDASLFYPPAGYRIEAQAVAPKQGSPGRGAHGENVLVRRR
jgi:hypothetical protein